MSERIYTVREIDELRRVLRERYEFGSCAPNDEGRVGRSYKESDMAVTVEEQLRTHILARHRAQDLIDADVRREEKQTTLTTTPATMDHIARAPT